jgi:hypothetical protein
MKVDMGIYAENYGANVAGAQIGENRGILCFLGGILCTYREKMGWDLSNEKGALWKSIDSFSHVPRTDERQELLCMVYGSLETGIR